MKERNSEKESILKYLTDKSVVQLAKNLIKIPSLEEGENEIARFLQTYMNDIDLETELVEVEADRFQPIVLIKGKGYYLTFNGPNMELLKKMKPGQNVTLDVDAHLVETNKANASYCYDGYKAFQPIEV